ncbi:MAG: SAM-dependent DNA methyltransferase [Nocardiopsaceae bacterium]|nr:SAM-dependent DNA methyltransferase [Nocardiopsaceae bacterium]
MMDAADYQKYIFGMLFLKRCSDEFEATRGRIYADELRRTGSEARAQERAEDPDSYIDTFYIPELARWETIRRLVDDVGSGLNKALRAIEMRNDQELHGVTNHIDFNVTIGNVSLGDRRLRNLIWHFSRYRLRNEDFEFPDMLGAAYEYLLKQFADQGGKKGGQSYTPRPVVRMMCRLVAPQPGESVYDPCAGSGGMLILAREYVDEHDRDGTAGRRLALAGQELNGAAWAMAKMNMLLHGIRDSDLRNGDTLADPRHIDDGRLRLFDKIITNPPFSIGYDQAETRRHFGTRMRYGWTPGTGKKADLMFVQHMLAVLRPAGIAATVMPHGVLFRGGAEQDIRIGLLRDDCVEAVIGLPENLFYGTGIPTCILILRGPDGHREHAGQVLFINADREFAQGRAQNQLGFEHAEKIVTVYRQWRELDGYSRIVPVRELLAADANLNIRRWVDNTPPPEPQDVRAHLHGGVPEAEVAAAEGTFAAFGIRVGDLFAPSERRPGYLDFLPEGPEATAQRLADLAGPREAELRAAYRAWWDEHAKLLVELPDTRQLSKVRADLLDSFTKAVVDFGILDEFAAGGVVASWWGDTQYDLKSLAAGGFGRVVEGWAASIDALLAPDPGPDGKLKTKPAAERRKALDHKLVPHLLPDYLAELEAAEAAYAAADAAYKEALQESANQEDDDDGDEMDLDSLKADRTAAQRKRAKLEKQFLATLNMAVSSLTPAEECDLVLRILHEDLAARLDARITRARREMIVRFRTWADKYAVSLDDLETARQASSIRLANYLQALGYA